MFSLVSPSACGCLKKNRKLSFLVSGSNLFWLWRTETWSWSYLDEASLKSILTSCLTSHSTLVLTLHCQKRDNFNYRGSDGDIKARAKYTKMSPIVQQGQLQPQRPGQYLGELKGKFWFSMASIRPVLKNDHEETIIVQHFSDYQNE